MSIIYLQKENNDYLSHCDCDDGLVSVCQQMDCPWCGCGWLFTCIDCRRAFTFAKAVEINSTWEEIAEKAVISLGIGSDQDLIDEFVTELKESLADIELGKSYVYLDGAIVAKDTTHFRLEGIHSEHSFKKVPQLNEKVHCDDSLLCDIDYWQGTRY